MLCTSWDLGNSQWRAIAVSDHTSEKRCTQCGNSYPATTEYFTRTKSTKDGLHTKCKTCKRANNRAWWAANADDISERRKEAYPQYAEDRNAYHKEWRERNREKDLAQKKDQYWANREQNLATSKAWREKNREYKREQDKLYAQRNADKIKEKQRKWEMANRERLNEKRRPKRIIHQQARETRKLGLPSAFTAQDWQRALSHFGGCCAVCGRPPGLFHTLAMDHWIPLSSPDCPGTIPGNIVPLCHGEGGCNNSKNNRNAQEWLVWKFGKRKGKDIAVKIQSYFAGLGGAL